MGTDTLKVELGANGVRAGVSIDELVDIARYAATHDNTWGATNCTGFVYAVSNVAGVPLNPGVTNIGNIVGNNPLTVQNGVAYVVSADFVDGWTRDTAISGSSIDYTKIRVGDILRIQTSGGGGTAGVHSMIVTEVNGANPGQISVVDNLQSVNGVTKITEHSLSMVIDYLNNSGTGSINTFWIHRLDPIYVANNVPNTLAGAGAGDFTLLPDIPSDSSTTAVLEVGSSQQSFIGSGDASDWFRVYLTAGQTYSFAVRGSETGNGTLSDPMLRLRSPNQALLLEDNNGGGARDARISGFTAAETGYYFVTAYANGVGTGTYTISAVQSAVTADILGTTATTSTLNPGTSFSSTIASSGDQDWFRISLVAGQTYTFTQSAGSGSTLDSYLRLLNSSGTQLDVNDDFSGRNSQITFTATSSGTYYLSAQGYGSSTGAFTIAASAGTGGTGNPTAGADSISGSSANNTYDGLGGNDTIMGNGGNDTILGGSGNDSLYGGTGSDSLDGGIGADRAYGDSGNDLIRGGDGNDSLFGGSGNDAIRGDAGNDILYGGSGNDTLYGDAGRDVFVFNMALGSTNVEIIVGFSVVDDTMYLDDAIFTRLSTGTLTSAAFARNTTGLASDSLDRIIYETNTGRLYYDADGTGTASARVHFATIATNLAITQSDFFVY